MTVFNQHGQNVGCQQNAGGDINLDHVQINLDHVQNQTQLVEELEKLKSEISKAAEAQIMDIEIFTDADYQMTKAIQQAKKKKLDKKSIIGHLNNAKSLLEGVTATGAIVTALDQIFQLITSLL